MAQPRKRLAQVVSRQLGQQPANIAELAGIAVLDQQSGDVPTHIGPDLAGKPGPVAAMAMKCDGGRLVAAGTAVMQDTIPVFRIPGAAGGADIEALVEKPDPVEDRLAERHAGSRADVPARAGPALVLRIEGRPEIAAPETAAEAPMPLEDDLSLRVELGRKHQAGDGPDLRRDERARNPGKPVRMQHDIVIRVNDEIPLRPERPRVAGNIEARAIFPDIVGPGSERDRSGFVAGGSIVDHE